MITKTLTETCGSIWVVKSHRKNEEAKTVQIGLAVYKNQDALKAKELCRRDSITVPSTGYNGTVAWCENALKTDPNSKLKSS